MRAPGAPSRERAGGAPPSRWRLRPSVEVFPARDGTVYLLRPGPEPDLAVREADAADCIVLSELEEAACTSAELVSALAARRVEISAQALGDKLDALSAAGVLIAEPGVQDPLDPGDAERFARQLPYFAETGPANRAQRRLRDATAVVLGCGGLGTWALAALVSAGVGAVRLVDDDAVERGNLNRQILYGEQDLGRPKVEVAARWVRGFDPAVRVEAVAQRLAGPADAGALVRGADVVLQLADWPPYELARWVNAACVAERIPFITAGQIPPLLKVGPTYVPGRTGCFGCHERALRRAYPLYDELTTFRAANPRPATTLGPASGVVGTLVASEVMHLLTGEVPATAGRAMLLDMRTLELRSEPVERDRHCPVCRDCVQADSPDGLRA